MRIVIKLAGALLEDDQTVRTLASQVAALAKDGHQILVVHGGGRLFTATLKRMGIESKFVGGSASYGSRVARRGGHGFCGIAEQKSFRRYFSGGPARRGNFRRGCTMFLPPSP